MQQLLVISAIGKDTPRLIQRLAKAAGDCGCNIEDSRSTLLGNEISIVILASGNWDVITKLEDQCVHLQKELDLQMVLKRTEEKSSASKGMPYAIDVVCSDRAGVVHDICKFMIDNEVEIQDMYSSTYETANTGTRMFSLHMNINVPVNTSIAALRGDFMEFCDRLNLDAIMEPVK